MIDYKTKTTVVFCDNLDAIWQGRNFLTLWIRRQASGEIVGRVFAKEIPMKPIIIADIPTAVSGTESIIKYDMGENIAPAR